VKTINIVFARPPAGVSDEEFNTWYDAHLYEILAIPGFEAAQRFQLRPAVVDPEAPAPYRFFALFELDGDPVEIMEGQKRLGLDTRESYVEYKKTDTKGPPLPDWWDDVTFASWTAEAVGDRVVAPS
jgi:hypothetical protein